MGSLPVEENTIPTIDISSFLDPNSSEEAKDNVVEQVRSACHTYGFFQLKGHGITPADREGIIECAKRFFELPMEERMEVQIKNSMGKSLRGYEPPGIQIHQKGLKADTKEVCIILPDI